MDFLILMFVIFMVLGPVMGYSRYNNRRQLPPGQNPAQFHGPYGQQPGSEAAAAPDDAGPGPRAVTHDAVHHAHE